MPIEFRCGQCGTLLRTPDGTAGKQAKCPQCGAATMVPGAEDSPSGPPQPGYETGGGYGPAGPSPGALNPYQSPAAYAGAGEYAGALPSVQSHVLDFGDVFGRAWEIFKVQWGMCLAVIVIVGVINFGFNFVVGTAFRVAAVAARDPMVFVLMSVMSNVIVWLFQVWIGIGQALFFLRTARGEPASVGDIFAGGRYFAKIVGASLIVSFIVFLPVVVGVLPGVVVLAIGDVAAGVVVMVIGGLAGLVISVYLGLGFSQFYYLILDRDVPVMESLTLSRQLMAGNMLTLLAIDIAAFGLVVAGILACCVGALATVPLVALLIPVVYLAITGQPTADRLWPAPAGQPRPPQTPYPEVR